jgi:prepilin-type N-terminal cleavage/methylation domain-containing protein
MQPRGSREQGFTLIELLIAVIITGLAFVGIFALVHLGVDAQVYAREMSDAEQVGPAILAQIAADLQNAYYYNVAENDCFDGRMIDSGGGKRTDQMHFITTRHSLLADSELSSAENGNVFSPLTEVSYVCKEGEGEFFELHRREQNFVDDEPFKGGYYRMVSDRLLSLKIEYTGYDLGTTDPNSGLPGNLTTGDAAAGDLTAEGEKTTDPAKSLGREDREGEEGETTTLEWEKDWVAKVKGSLPVAVKIEMVISPDIDPNVMKRLTHVKNGQARLDKSYVTIILLPQYRENAELMRATYSWDGSIKEPSTGPGARGRGGRGDGPGDGKSGPGGQKPGANPIQGMQIGGGGTRPGGSNPFLDALRGGGKKN